MKIKSISIQKGEPLPYGVTVYKDRINFSITFESANECRINFYHRVTQKAIGMIVADDRFKIGRVFAVSVFKKAIDAMLKKEEMLPEDLAYTCQIDDREFADPYTPVLNGRWEYKSSENKRKLSGGFYTEEFDWMEDKPLEIPLSQSIIYKVHVRGFTKHGSSGVLNKGTFLGMTEKAAYLKELGITCLQLMPVYEYNEIFQLNGPNGQGKLNYWGYSEDNYYFAPKASYAAHPDRVCTEFKTMIRTFHQNGMEIMMEMNFVKGTNPVLALEALRYWVLEYHVDGFVIYAEDMLAQMAALDSVLGRVKLVFHYWSTDLLKGNNEHKRLLDYNWDYSISTKRFNRGEEEQVREVANNFIKNHENKGIVNYITNHDGFTLADLYSYDVKHNESNGEKNQDGFDYNYSWNCGREGKTENKKILGLRKQLIRNAFTILLLSQGTPLILAGDEFLNSQEGNNNAYCQDNEITWLDWKKLYDNPEIFAFVKELIKIRKKHPVFHKELPLRGMDYIYCGMPDVSFHGTKAWYADYNHYSRVLGILFSGRYAKVDKEKDDNTFYLAFNMHGEKKGFYLPNTEKGEVWSILIHTFTGEFHTEFEERNILDNQRFYEVPARSIVVFISGIVKK